MTTWALPIRSAAWLLGVSVSTVRRWVAQGDVAIICAPGGHVLRVSVPSLLTFLGVPEAVIVRVLAEALETARSNVEPSSPLTHDPEVPAHPASSRPRLVEGGLPLPLADPETTLPADQLFPLQSPTSLDPDLGETAQSVALCMEAFDQAARQAAQEARDEPAL